MFSHYTGSYDRAVTVLGELTERNRRFQTFITEAAKDPRCNNLNLLSYLIMPVQRIPRYFEVTGLSSSSSAAASGPT